MPVNIDFAEVTRLTKEGRLDDAFALLKSLGGAAPSAAGMPPVVQGTEVLGMRPGALGEPIRETLKTLGAKLVGLNPQRSARSPLGAEKPAPAGSGFETRTFTNAFGSRDYKLFRPSGRNTALPLVVMLHGCQQGPDDFAAGTRMNELAEEQGFFVAYPGQPTSANPSRCWNWFSAGDQIRDKGEPSLIAGITRRIMSENDVEPARVYVAGLSAGGAEAAILGAAYPDLFAAVGVHSGLACGAAKDMASAFTAMRQGGVLIAPGADRPVPTIVFHGDGDNTVHPVNGDQVIAQARSRSRLDTTITAGRSAGGVGYTRTVQADRAGRPVLEHWVLHGAGHAWSGGSPAGTFTDPRGPDASREMLRFFAEQHSPAMRAAAE